MVMNIRTLAWKTLRRRRSRALFTGLGIFLGIGTFVAPPSLTSQMEGAVQDKLDRYGANILITPRADDVSLGFGNIALGGTQVARAKLSTDDRGRIEAIPRKDRARAVGPAAPVPSGRSPFRGAGVLAPTGEKEDGMVIGEIRSVQELAGSPKGVTYIEVAAHCKDCPVDEIVAEISGAVPGAKGTAIRQVGES